MKDQVYLNASAIKNALTERDLRQWWIADQLKVDRKTIARWISGKVRRTDVATAQQLADLLAVSIDSITVQEEAELLASAADQQRAAKLLATSQLADQLGPLGEWNVLETLLKAHLISDLPKSVLGELYNQLAIASWRQNKIAEAEQYSLQAQKIGQETGDKGVLAHAWLNLGNIDSWHGRIDDSLKKWQSAIDLKPFLGSRKAGSACNNFAAMCWEAGLHDQGLAKIEQALEEFEGAGTAMNFSIAHGQKALLHIDMQQAQPAKHHIDQASASAKNGPYPAGVRFAGLVQAVWNSQFAGETSIAALIEAGLEGLDHKPIMIHLNYELAGRAWRQSGHFDQSIEALNIGLGLETSHHFPMSLAALHKELAYTYAATQRVQEASEHAYKALALYEQCGASKRIDEVTRILQS